MIVMHFAFSAAVISPMTVNSPVCITDSFEERLKNCNDRKKRKLADEIDGYKKSDERPAGANSDSD